MRGFAGGRILPRNNFQNQIVYRREALIRKAQPESLDDPLKVTAPHERVFWTALLLLLLVLAAAGWAVLAA